MNILIAANYSAPFGGNFIGSLQDLGIKINDRGDSVVFLFPKIQNGERPWVQWLRNSGYRVILADLSVDEQRQAEFFKGVLDENKIDLIHLHFELFNGLLLKHPEVFSKRKVLIHDHMGFRTGVSRIKQRAYLAAISAVYWIYGYGVATVSDPKKKAYVFLPKKWHIPNGLSLKRNTDHFSSREETRAELNINNDQLLVTMLGWEMKRKGVDIAAKAVTKLYKAGKHVLLGIIGGDAERYHAFIGENAAETENDCIRIIESREDVYSLLRASDVFLSASRDEGFSYAILEAISQETPTVMSGIPETAWAAEYDKCFVYPTEDYNACADAILLAASCGRGKSNSEEIVKRFSIEKWCNNVLEKYDIMMRK